jgi:K+-transporting ATPase ATPase C chain
MIKIGSFVKSTVQCFLLLVVLSLLTGIIYPLCMTISGRLLFPAQMEGSLKKRDGIVVGSQLLGQPFSSNRYFHARPSSINYIGLPSGGSNQTQISLTLRDSVLERKKRFALINEIDSSQVPADMLYTSGSGLDPHISPMAAYQQIQRICKARGYDSTRCSNVHTLVKNVIEKPQWLIFGDHRVNVLTLNLALDSLEVFNER